MKLYDRQIRKSVVYGIVFLIVVFYMVPLTAISTVTTLENLEKLPFLKPVVEQPAIKTVLEAYLPQIALIICHMILLLFLF
jgi:calcium permeable stress-gated cation channel